MIDKIDQMDCTGCKMCKDICPVNAILYDTDREGFWYPKVDYKKCVKCSICINYLSLITPPNCKIAVIMQGIRISSNSPKLINFFLINHHRERFFMANFDIRIAVFIHTFTII